MYSRNSRQFKKNYETKKYSRPVSSESEIDDKPVSNTINKEPDPSAELRILSVDDLDDLIESIEYKVIIKKKKKFLWTVKEKIKVDNYKSFLDSNTRLLPSFDDRAFLGFEDLSYYLETKNIPIDSCLSEKGKRAFQTREEFSFLLDYKLASKLLEELDNLIVTDEDLKNADEEKLYLSFENLFDKQRAEIEIFKSALREVKSDTLLLIRIIE